ncbi:ferric reductase-like transmembrane domain-containing protein [Zestomonas carbonaria]|uniref:Ferric oxidoreductase domain-containing protein n=1 Tax=Zestomonas carbonaria TaxID=2762745 RepID=A0A7U7EQW7_9GAMM|nr:ferric reductase-like transmembrane domain-containing protein [Pseudomonas carbonaria]CAD5109532.1 hypothetical protein PSEWESI4_03837 [Pseudomonas carbonaria]
MNTRTNHLGGWRLFSLLAVSILAMAALILAFAPDSVEGTRSVIRATARTSFALFFTAFTASAFAVLVPSPFSRSLLRERRIIGLSFAFSHFVHAIAIFAYGQLAPEFWPNRTALGNLPGSIGYAFILLLTLTSFKGPARLLGAKAWKRLHVTGMWVIAAIFTYSYFKRIPTNLLYAIPFGIVVAAVAVRLVGKLALAARRNQRAPANPDERKALVS